jgi:hypothetical protein
LTDAIGPTPARHDWFAKTMPNEVGTKLIDSPSILAQWALAVGEAWGGSEPQLLAIAHDLSI